MDVLFSLAQRIAPRFLRYSMALVVLWIGALKFVDPSPVVGLLKASLPFLASNGFVYGLGAVEVIVALLLFVGIAPRYVGLALLALFAGTLTIFVIAPMVSYGDNGFPLLSLVGEFLLKDLVLFATSVTIIAQDTVTATQRVSLAQPAK